jgi:adenylate cyclase class IV
LRRNVELKARDPDPARSRAVCAELGAEDRGLLSQRDTYFRAPNGRLKLREDGDPPAELIAYTRADLPGERESAYRIVEIPQPEELRHALAETLGIEIVVAKRRTSASISTKSRGSAASSSSRPSPAPTPTSRRSSSGSRASATPSASRRTIWSR